MQIYAGFTGIYVILANTLPRRLVGYQAVKTGGCGGWFGPNHEISKKYLLWVSR